MRRLLTLLIVAGGFLLAGCGGGDRTIAPTNVPPPPKHGPMGEKGPGGDTRATKPSSAAPVIQP